VSGKLLEAAILNLPDYPFQFMLLSRLREKMQVINITKPGLMKNIRPGQEAEYSLSQVLWFRDPKVER
jgi:hypothetical protein